MTQSKVVFLAIVSTLISLTPRISETTFDTTPETIIAMAGPELAEIENLLVVWREQHIELGSREGVNHVLIFENKGDVVGVSNPHPHCQIYATNFVFKTIENEARVSQRHLTETGRALFQDILEAEHRMLATSKLDKTASG